MLPNKVPTLCSQLTTDQEQDSTSSWSRANCQLKFCEGNTEIQDPLLHPKECSTPIPDPTTQQPEQSTWQRATNKDASATQPQCHATPKHQVSNVSRHADFQLHWEQRDSNLSPRSPHTTLRKRQTNGNTQTMNIGLSSAEPRLGPAHRLGHPRSRGPS